jgi:hypothetical protein
MLGAPPIEVASQLIGVRPTGMAIRTDEAPLPQTVCNDTCILFALPLQRLWLMTL